LRWQYLSLALAEPWSISIALRVTAQDCRIAVFKKRALLSVWQGQGRLPALAWLQEIAALISLGSEDRSRPQQITCGHHAAETVW